MILNERFDSELCGPCLKTIILYRISDGEKINELLVDSENNKITFFVGENGHKNDNRLKNTKVIDVFMPNKEITLNDKGEYYWKKGEWKMIKNFIKFYNIFS
jgi:hypothetical protein